MYLPELIKLLSLALTLSINTLLFFLVRQAHPKTDLSKVFGLFSLSSSLWLVTIFSSISPQFSSSITILARLSIFFAVFHIFSCFLLVKILPGDKLILGEKEKFSIFFITALVAILTLTPLVFKSASLLSDGGVNCVPGVGMLVFGAYVYGFVIASVCLLIKKIRREQGEKRKYLLLILSSLLLMIGLIAVTIYVPIVLKNDATGIMFAPLFVLLFSGSLVVAVIRYRLFDIKLIAVQILVGLFLLTVIIETFIVRLFNYTYFQLIFLAVTVVLGLFLIKYINKEIRAREHAVNLSNALQNTNSLLEELNGERESLLLLITEHLKNDLSVVGRNDRLIKLAKSFDYLVALERNGTELLQKENVDINKFAEDILEKNRKIFMEKKMRIDLEKSRTAKLVKMDVNKIGLVLDKLLDNATKYSFSGSKINVCIRADGDGVAMWIKDEGIGFTHGEWDDLYGKFYRSRQATDVYPAGTGLSLFLSKKIVEAHGGRVWAQSYGYGKGAEFGFWLPYGF